MNLNIKELSKEFGKSLILKENLSKYNWFNTGGLADIFFRPDSKDQLIQFLKKVNTSGLKIYVLGAGSNILIRDKGVQGIVIKLSSNFSKIQLLDNDKIEVGAATLDRKVSDFARDNNIGQLEFLSCIPGSIGGAVRMNSGCFGSDISQVLLSIKAIDKSGNEKEIKKEEIKFYYRDTDLSKDYIILSATLQGKNIEKEIIEKKQRELIDKKKISQPSQIKTGGSTFKNNKNKKAWVLIKEAGCEKLYVGDAKISEKHCNFFVNQGKAKSSDIEKLINKVKHEVYLKTGENLELEIKIIGDEK